MRSTLCNIILIIPFLLLFGSVYSQNINSNYQHYDLRSGLAQMKVHCVYEDSIGNIWVGTRNGLSKFNGENFTNYFRKDGLSGNRILAITTDSIGNLLLVTNNGVSFFDGHSFDNIISPISLVNGNLIQIEDSRYLIFADTIHPSYLIDLKKRKIDKYRYKELLKTINRKSIYPEYKYLDNDYDYLEVKKIIQILNEYKSTNRKDELYYEIGQNSNIKVLFKNSKFNNHSIRYNFFNSKMTVSIPSGCSLITRDTVFGINKSGDIWNYPFKIDLGQKSVELNNGQIVVPSDFGVFILSKPWFTHFSEKELPYVWSIVETDEGEFFTNSWNHGLYKITDGIIEKLEPESYFSVNFLTKSTKDKNEILYFPSNRGILKRSNKGIFELIGKENDYFTLHFDSVRNLIVSGIINGISILKDKKEKIIDLENHGLHTGEYFNSVSQDKYNRYWMSSYSGLCCYDPDKEKVVNFDEKMTEITKKGSFGIFQDDNSMWLGLNDGLAMVDINTMTLERINSVVLNSMVKGIINYNDSLLLIGAKTGLYLFNKKKYLEEKTIDIVQINKSHGYFGVEPGFDCFYRDSKDRIWITAANHLSILTPREDFINPLSIQPNFTAINHDRIHFSHKNRVYNIKEHNDKVEIEYEAVGVMRPDNVMFKYQLDNQEWSPWIKDKKVVLTNLKHGKHNVKLRAGPSDLSVENFPVDFLSFKINLPFYKWIWVRVLFWIITIGTLLFYLVNFYRIRQKQKRYQEKIKENHYLKNQILLSELNPHFIFNALSSIQSNVIQDNKMKASEQIVRLSKLIRAILNSSVRGNLSSDSIENLQVPIKDELNLIKYYLTFEKEKHRDRFDFEIIYPDNFDLDSTFIPPMLLQPLVENSIKHGVIPLKNRKGKIEIKVNSEDDFITIIVSDNGIGIKASLEENAKKLSKPESLGTKIIAERIQVLKELGLEILFDQKSSPKGTTTIIKLKNE